MGDDMSQDIHICGRCKQKFHAVKLFIEHKEAGCLPNLRTDEVTVASDVSQSSLYVQGNAKTLEMNLASLLCESVITSDSPSIDTAVTTRESNIEPSSTSVVEVPAAPEASNPEKTKTASKAIKRFQCDVESCSYQTAYLKDLHRHRRTHTGEKPFTCSICRKSFNRADKLKAHERLHAGEKPYKCKECDYAAGDNSSLKKHMRVHSDERPFKCQICPYASRNSSQLVVHLRTHTGDCPFHCPICNTKFKINSDLKRHMRMHTGEKPFTCSFCDYSCAINGNLKTHIRLNHSTENLQKCSQCEYSTPSRKALREHEKTHDSKSLKCPECQYSCSSKGALRHHLYIHSSEKPFKCDFCPYASRQPGNVRTHKKKRHPDKLQRLKKINKKSDSPSNEDNANSPNRLRNRPLCVKSYKCTMCDEAFVRQDSLRSHVRQHQESLHNWKAMENAAVAVLQLSNPPESSTAPITLTTSSDVLSQVGTVTKPTMSVTPTVHLSNETITSSLSSTQMVSVPIHTNTIDGGFVSTQTRVIEQALQQSGVIEGQSTIETLDANALASPHIIAYIQQPQRTLSQDDVLANSTLLPGLSLKANAQPLMMSNSQVLTLNPEQTEQCLETTWRQSTLTSVCSLQQAPVMYQLQSGIGLIPVVAVSSQSIQPVDGATTIMAAPSTSISCTDSVQHTQVTESCGLVTTSVAGDNKMLNCIGLRIMGAEDTMNGSTANMMTNSFGPGLGTLLQPVLLAAPNQLSDPVFSTQPITDEIANGQTNAITIFTSGNGSSERMGEPIESSHLVENLQSNSTS